MSIKTKLGQSDEPQLILKDKKKKSMYIRYFEIIIETRLEIG